MLDGHPEITGGVLSVTVNVVEQVEVFKAASLTVIVTVVTPVPTIVPAVGDCVITNELGAVQLSEAVTPPIKSGTTAWQFEFA